MNKWSKSLPSINVLPDETKLNTKPVRIPQSRILPSIKNLTREANANARFGRPPQAKTLPCVQTLTEETKVNTKPIRIPKSQAATNEDSDSLTDVSLISPSKPSSINLDKTRKFYNPPNQYDSVIEIDAMGHNEFVPVDQLYDSLFAYANSFRIDDTTYLPEDIKAQIESPPTLKPQPESVSNQTPPNPEPNNLTRHKSCEDVLQNNKPTTTTTATTTSIKPNSNELLPSHVFPPTKIEHDDNGNHSDESTTVTDGSKFQWEYLSEVKEQTKKASINITSNYQVTTKIKPIKSRYLQDHEQRSLGHCSKKISLSPIIIREKTNDLFIQQNIDIRLIRPPTPPLPATPIIIREILHRPSPSNHLPTKHQSPPSSLTAFTEYNRSSKPPIVPKPRPSIPVEHETHQQSKEIIIQYDQVNVTVAKSINQREEIKRVDPNQYLQQHGSSLYANDVFQDILTNIIS